MFPSLERRRLDLLGDLGETTELLLIFPSDTYAPYLHWKLLAAVTWRQFLRLFES